MSAPSAAAPSGAPETPPLARLAGLSYLVIILCGVWAEGIARPSLISPGDAAATAEGITANLPLFRASLGADLAMGLADVALAVFFFLLLRPFGPGLALFAMTFRLIQAALIGASLVLLAGVPAALEAGMPDTALLLTALHGTGYDIGLVFFGVNCLLMAVLLTRAGLPRALALGIGAAGLVYLTGSAARLFAPDLHPVIQPAYLVPLLAESALCLWLLIRGRI